MIHYKDLLILGKLFFKEIDLILIYNPKDQNEERTNSNTLKNVWSEIELSNLIDENKDQRLLIFNLSEGINSSLIKEKNIAGCFHFSKPTESTNAVQFSFINNTDQSMRWVFPNSNTHPIFLSLYNNTGWKATCYKLALRLAYQFSFSSFFSSGSFWIESEQAELNRFYNDLVIDEYAIFTGTAGENRKAILTLHQNNSCSHFVKIPLTQKANALIKNEQQQLAQLHQLQFKNWVLPNGIGTKDYLCLTNVEPKTSLKSANAIRAVHLNALQECYTKTTVQCPPKQISTWSQIIEGIDYLNSKPKFQNDISQNKIKVLTYHINQLAERFSATTLIPVAVSHGDFTPWNMYETADKIHVYDWEMSTNDQPIFFDLFHYVFQTNILILQNSFKEIQSDLEELKDHPIVKNMMEQFSINWTLHYNYYLLYIVSYYVPLYIQQKDLHAQAHWLIDCWTTALATEVLENKNGIVLETIHNQ